MNTNGIKFLSDYRFRDDRFNSEYWQSEIIIGGRSKVVVDAAGMASDSQNVLCLVPYGRGIRELDSFMGDGDLCAYFTPPQHVCVPTEIEALKKMNPGQIKGVLKGRASHAELGYLSQERGAMQVSLWNQRGLIQPEDREFHMRVSGADVNDIVNIYRLSLAGYGITEDQEKSLKSEVKRWKEIVCPVKFPCDTMDIDPADFSSLSELEEIAVKLINHSPDDPREPLPYLFNCIQWSTLVFSLAVCFPLSEEMLVAIGAKNAYDRNWASRLGYAQKGLHGIEELPIPFYTVPEIIENTIDLYLPEVKSALMAVLPGLPVAQAISQLGGSDCLRVMPNAFVMENRLRALGFPRKTKTVVEYVCTAVPISMLKRG